MGRRTTIDVITMLEEVNRRNRVSTCDAGVREGWNSALEFILHQCDLYAGFGYMTEAAMQSAGHNIDPNKPKQLPGVIHNEDPKLNQFPDETRRFYYCHRKLQKHARTSV